MVEFLREFLPVVIVAALIGSFSLAFFFAWLALKKHKDETDDKERSISDKELIRRLLVYGKPHWKSFVAVLGIMIISVAYDVLSPLLMKEVQELITVDFELKELFTLVAIYAGILIVSMICTYLQAMILQRTGQKILSQIRLDTFTHIEKLSHEQLNNIPVGKLVTRVTRMLVNIKEMRLGSLVTRVTSLPTGMLFSCSWLSCSILVKVSRRILERIF